MESLYCDGNVTFVGQDAECIPPWLAKKYGQVTKRLDLSFNKLRSLKGLVGFIKLEELVLDNNQLTDDIELPLLPSLQTLTMNKNNHLVNLDNILDQIASKLPSLKYLSLLGNKACPNQLSNIEKDEEDYQRYRYYVLYRLPNLKFLDSTPVKSSERKEAERVGQYMRVVTAEQPLENSTEDSDSDAFDSSYTPLPTSSPKEGVHRGTFGKCRT